jgi:hypothetical protein
MNFRKELKLLAVVTAVFLGCYFLPIDWPRFRTAVLEGLRLLRWYAREHVLLCLIPAFFIAGGISVFLSQQSVMKYLGVKANKVLAYSVASVSGAILAVCSCTVLPLFAGIYRMGAGLGPATTFLYSGPAINILAIVLTASVLGPKLGIARAVGAVGFSVVIGLLMQLIFRKEEAAKAAAAPQMPEEQPSRSLWKNAAFFATLTAILIFANWARSGDARAVLLCCPNGLREFKVEGQLIEKTDDYVRIKNTDTGEVVRKSTEEIVEIVEEPGRVYLWRWAIVGLAMVLLAGELLAWFSRAEAGEWVGSSWGYAKLILPPLAIGVFVAGLLLGSVTGEGQGLIPNEWVQRAVGGEGLRANFLASISAAFMYFATLTEVPILEGLLRSGMGEGPALSLLLAGPALSLPNMLVIRSVMGTKKTLVYVSLVVIMATTTGWVFGRLPI